MPWNANSFKPRTNFSQLFRAKRGRKLLKMMNPNNWNPTASIVTWTLFSQEPKERSSFKTSWNQFIQGFDTTPRSWACSGTSARYICSKCYKTANVWWPTDRPVSLAKKYSSWQIGKPAGSFGDHDPITFINPNIINRMISTHTKFNKLEN